ncbi:MAG TPA: hypothetical protein PLG33_07250 [Prolixibacteraceae bacterium]|nr:hypothetical protein [Prolixibacteraceae bacterium]HPR85830.1 hypothetical protein [Prolixibacteraceae bacterium]
MAFVCFFRAAKIDSYLSYLDAQHKLQENLIFRSILVDIGCNYLLKPYTFKLKSIKVHNFSYPVIHNGILYIRKVLVSR